MANSPTAAPAPLQVLEEDAEKDMDGITVVITCACMLLICLCFITAATKHRLWHDNSPIHKLHKFVLRQILDPLMDLTSVYLLTYPAKGIHLVWGVILMIAGGSLTCTANAYTLSDSRSSFMSLFFIALVSYHLIKPSADIRDADHFCHFVINLWAIWAVIVLKTVQKFFSFWVAKRAYGTDRTNFISDYMRLIEHTLSTDETDPDPVSMRGYKYIVSGEDKVLFQTTITDGGQADVDIAKPLSDEVVTVERVWDCMGRDRPLGRRMDSDGKLMDICLSFALMKLLKRRFLDFTTEEQISKSRTLVLQGLLNSEDKNRAFRVIRTELGFLQDLFYSHYPIIFGCGFPIYNYLLSLLLLGATGFLAKTAYSDTKHLGGNDTDLCITYVLVAMIIVMEITETATYWLSDWNKVTLLINYVKFPWLHESYFISMALRFLCKIKIKQPVRDKIGQYSLLEQYGKFSIRAKLCNRRATCGNGVMTFCHASVKLPDEAKRMILEQLSQSNGGPLSNGESSLQRRNVMGSELGWTSKLPLSTQTILLWHIATCYCETIRPSQRPLASSGKEVAIALSKYCAYLVVFVPDLLPDQGNIAKRVLDKVVSEIDDLLEGVNDDSEMWKKIDLESRKEKTSTILGMGAKLGRTLVEMESISNEDDRWKVLAEFWAEYLLYLAPSSNVEAHQESLGSGGEFITHLWVLLYHAGVLERPEIGVLERRPEIDPNP